MAGLVAAALVMIICVLYDFLTIFLRFKNEIKQETELKGKLRRENIKF